MQVRDEDIFHIGQVYPLLAQQQGDVLRFHIHAEASLVPHTGDDERLNLVDVPDAGVDKHYFAVIPAQNKQQKVRDHPLTPP